MISINGRSVGQGNPVYFIADIAANHDGSLERAKELIQLAKEAGADAAKFQHFRADKIVSDYGFRQLGASLSHQAKWKKSVFEVYKDASLDWSWTEALSKHCASVGIDFFSSPYDMEAVDHLDRFVPAFKIGSGDITWTEMLAYIARKMKPVILATGASEIADVITAVDAVMEANTELVLMQCNTNYTAETANFRHICLNVLKTYSTLFPNVELGLSDHTLGHATVIGAVALGARVIEKHFTDDNTREGPDHAFSMNPTAWKDMVERTRELENALGSPIKRIEENELQTVIVQRRCIRAARPIKAGEAIGREDIDMLRPAPKGTLPPNYVHLVVGKRARKDYSRGEEITLWGIDP